MLTCQRQINRYTPHLLYIPPPRVLRIRRFPFFFESFRFLRVLPIIYITHKKHKPYSRDICIPRNTYIL